MIAEKCLTVRKDEGNGTRINFSFLIIVGIFICSSLKQQCIILDQESKCKMLSEELVKKFGVNIFYDEDGNENQFLTI